jgi:hypothetical protein
MSTNNDRSTRHYTQLELSQRWNVSIRTLEAWRSQRRGVAWLKIGGRVAYRLADIEEFEKAQLQNGGAK